MFTTNLFLQIGGLSSAVCLLSVSQPQVNSVLSSSYYKFFDGNIGCIWNTTLTLAVQTNSVSDQNGKTSGSVIQSHEF